LILVHEHPPMTNGEPTAPVRRIGLPYPNPPEPV
jgi:hypothetical protein